MVCQNENITIYILTFGYGNRKSYDDLLRYLELFDVKFVIDVRLNARAWTRRWYGQEIQKFCESVNVKYIAKNSLGNTSGKSNWVPPDREEANKTLIEISEIAQSQTTLLLCAEMRPAQCHRVDVAEQLHELTKTPVKHLE